jgi:nucleotide-binding universal stress UspA family protein
MTMTRIKRILVPTDFSATADEALACARTIAGLFGASLHLLHAFEDPVTSTAFAWEAYGIVPLPVRDEWLREAAQRLDERLPSDQKTLFNGTTAIVSGRPATVIVEYAATLGADLIVIGTHGRGGVEHALLGSVAERVVRTAVAPVLTIRKAPAGPVTRILVPTDFSETADAALEYAELWAETVNASIQLLHVLDDPSAAETLATEANIAEAPALRAATLRDAQSWLAHRAVHKAGITAIDSEIMFGHGARTIADYATDRGIDLIVMGTHGRTGIAHLLLGSVAERLVRTAPCAVLTVRHPKARRQHPELVYDVEHLPA